MNKRGATYGRRQYRAVAADKGLTNMAIFVFIFVFVRKEVIFAGPNMI